MIYQFKVTLKNVGVPVWRRIQVDSETTFEDFHYILMAAFEWLGYHMHEFEIRKTNGKRTNNTRIGRSKNEPIKKTDPFLLHINETLTHPEEIDLPRFLEEADTHLSDWFKSEKDRAFYTYDFGDDWEHEIVLEKILAPEPDVLYPLCTKAKNDAPYDDSRLDLLHNDIDLNNPDWKQIVEDINETFRTKDWQAFFLHRDDFI